MKFGSNRTKVNEETSSKDTRSDTLSGVGTHVNERGRLVCSNRKTRRIGKAMLSGKRILGVDPQKALEAMKAKGAKID